MSWFGWFTIFVALFSACAGGWPPATLSAPKACPGVRGSTDVEPLDIVILVDGSRSAGDPSGEDLDADGRTGRSLSRIFLTSSDVEDSLLAAQVAAARSLIYELIAADVRFGIVMLAGAVRGAETASRIYAPLLDETYGLDAALLALQSREPRGNTDFAEGLDLALKTLEQGRPPGTTRSARGLVFMMTDSGKPYVSNRDERGYRLSEYPELQDQISRARSLGAEIHTFAIVPEAVENAALLKALAQETGGIHRSGVPASKLHCALIGAVP